MARFELNIVLCIQGSLEEPAKNSKNCIALLYDSLSSKVLPIGFIAAYLQSDCGFWFH